MMIGGLVLCWSVGLLGQVTDIRRVELPEGAYWLALPADHDPEARYPLIVCLHGTETRADDILRFWLSLEADLPLVFVAPQGVDAGWQDADLKLIDALWRHLGRTVNFDPDRVLITGHSAGGAMAFHLLYAEGFEATVVAVTANYVPPTVTAQMVEKRREVPVFYAVGEADLNRPRMRDGLHLLRGAGVNVTVKRPPIGHVLSREIGQAALSWFESVCRRATRKRIDAARLDADHDHYLGPAAEALEAILANPPAHFPEHVAMAADLLSELQQPGRQSLARAQVLTDNNQPMAARKLLIEVEQRYQPSALAAQARTRRRQLDELPDVVRKLAAKRQAEQEQAAADLWQAALTALAEARLEAAQRYARGLLELYPKSAVADDARNLVEEIEAVTGPGRL